MATASQSQYVIAAGAAVDFPSGGQIGSLAGAGTVTIESTGGSLGLTFGGDNKSTTFSGTISAPSTDLTKIGTGTFILSGTGTIGLTTISTGTLQIGDGGATGSLTGKIVNNGRFMVNRTGTLILDGLISGTGTFGQIGPGTTILNGANTYTGLTSVSAGTLIVNNSIANSAVALSGGTLKGSGSVGALTAASGTTVAPGGSIGTLSVNGNLALAGGSTYQLEVDAGNADKIVVAGAATLAGTLQIVEAQGNYAAQTSYTILTASGGISGTFAGVTGNLAFLTPTLAYSSTAVNLTLSRNLTSFPSVATTPNQISTAAAIAAGGVGSALFSAVVVLTGPDAQTAFDSVSGEIHASLESALLQNSQTLRQTVLGRLRQTPDGSDRLAGRPTPVASTGANTMWGSIFGTWGDADSDGNAAAMSRNFSGLLLGVDHDFGNFRLGVNSGYTKTDLSIGARASSASVESTHLGVYAGATAGPLMLRAGGMYAGGRAKTDRSVVFTGFSDHVTAKEDAKTSQFFGEIGYGAVLGDVAIEPFAGLAWVGTKLGDFTERGGAAALAGTGSDDNFTYTTVGVSAARTFVTDSGAVVTPRVSVAWQHALDKQVSARSLSIAETSQAFRVFGVPLEQNQALMEAGMRATLSPNATFDIGYQGALSQHVSDHGAHAGLTWAF